MHKALTNTLEQAHWKHQGASQDLKKVLLKNNACYVLITCAEPSADGKIEVEMTYEGDACLAEFLIKSAQEIEFIDQDEPS